MDPVIIGVVLAGVAGAFAYRLYKKKQAEKTKKEPEVWPYTPKGNKKDP